MSFATYPYSISPKLFHDNSISIQGVFFSCINFLCSIESYFNHLRLFLSNFLFFVYSIVYFYLVYSSFYFSDVCQLMYSFNRYSLCFPFSHDLESSWYLYSLFYLSFFYSFVLVSKVNINDNTVSTISIYNDQITK